MSATAPVAPPSLLDVALSYAARGWAVLPLHDPTATPTGARCSCGKGARCGSPGKHPRTENGVKDATTDTATIRRWWMRWPDAGIGIATGPVSQLLVLDVDPRNHGDETIGALRRAIEIPSTVQALTGGGGEHLYFAAPSLAEGEQLIGVLGEGIDVKWSGGFVVAPPSRHASGKAYAWEASSDPEDGPLAEVPLDLLALLRKPGKGPAKGRGGRGEDARSTTLLGRAFEHAGRVGQPLRNGLWSVVCPWADEHTTGEAGDSSTAIFPARDGSNLGGFLCFHGHCRARSNQDALARLSELDPDAVAKARAEVPRAANDRDRRTGERRAAPGVDELGEVQGAEWQRTLARSKDGKVKSCFSNLTAILRGAYGDRLRRNAMTERNELDGAAFGDVECARLRECLELEHGVGFGPDSIGHAVGLVASEREYHPVRSYLSGLAWDGVDRLERIAPELLGTPPSDLYATYTKKWAISVVARALSPGCKVDTTLVLVGRQGARKSTFFAVLGGDWFCDSAMDAGKDGLMQLATAWIYEWPELEGELRKRNTEETKAFLSCTKDVFRTPYGVAPINHPRTTVIVGTTNEREFLSDPTGDRRFWIIRTGDVNVELTREWRDQIWAEAVARYNAGEQWWLDDAQDAARDEANASHRETDPWESEIVAWLKRCNGTVSDSGERFVTSGEVLLGALGVPAERWTRNSEMRVGRILNRELGADKKRRVSFGGRRSWVWVLP